MNTIPINLKLSKLSDATLSILKDLSRRAAEPDACDICEGDPDECYYRQTDVDSFTCDNQFITIRIILK